MGTQLEEKRQKRSHCLPFIFRNHVYRAVSNPFKSSNTFSSIHSADIDQAPTELSTLRCAKEPGAAPHRAACKDLTGKQGREEEKITYNTE